MRKLAKYREGRDLFSHLHDDLGLGRLLSSFDWLNANGITNDLIPIDLEEQDKQFVVHADLPGFKTADIEVTMENGVLTIKAKREQESEKKEKNFLRIERFSGSLLRQLALPESVDQNKIQAKYTDGVLEVILPKATQNIGRKIDVKQG